MGDKTSFLRPSHIFNDENFCFHVICTEQNHVTVLLEYPNPLKQLGDIECEIYNYCMSYIACKHA